MKLKITIEVDVSKTIAETMQRNGFSACPDGSAMQIKVPNAPAIPKRKTKVIFSTSQEDGKCVDNGATCGDQKQCCKQGKG